MKVIRKPYNLLGIAAIFPFILSFHFSSQTFDIHIRDTYLVIDKTHLFKIITFFLLLLWILYWLAKRVLLSHLLTWIHIIITLLSLAVIYKADIDSIFHYESSDPLSRETYYSARSTFNHFERRAYLLTITFLVFLLGQLLFVVNIVGGLIRKKLKS